MPRASTRAALALAALLITAQAAGARVFQMSGHWTQDRGTMLGLDLPPMPAPVPGAGVATATGSAPARLTLVPGRFSEMGGGVLQALPAPFVQLSTRVDAQGPIASAMFAPGPKPSRPASFTRAIAAPGSSNVASVRYRAGPNQFGGTARLLVSGSASVSHMVFTTGGVGWITSRVAHEPLAFGDALGGAYAGMATLMLPAFDITQQPGFAMGPITMPGPVIAMGPAQALVSTGFPWTTGQVRLFVNGYAPGDPSSLVTLTGLDARTPLGAGNIVMVAGGLVRRDFFGRGHVLLQSGVLDLTLAPLDVPALSHAAYAALALSLLLVGYALRRRL